MDHALTQRLRADPDGEVMRLNVAVAGVRTQALAGIRAKEFSATIATLERVVDNLSNGNGTGPQRSRR